MTKYTRYPSKPSALPGEERRKGKISSFQRLGTKSPSCHFCTWESTLCLLAPRGCLNSQKAGCRELAIIDPGVLKQAVLSSKHCYAPESEFKDSRLHFFSLMIHFVFPRCLLPRSAIYNCLWTRLPAPGKERGRSEKVSRAQVIRKTPLPRVFQHGVPPLGFRLPLHIICSFQALERHNIQKASTYFLILILWRIQFFLVLGA